MENFTSESKYSGVKRKTKHRMERLLFGLSNVLSVVAISVSLGMWWPGFTQQTTIFMKYARAIENQLNDRTNERERRKTRDQKMSMRFCKCLRFVWRRRLNGIQLWIRNKRKESRRRRGSYSTRENRIPHAKE